MSKLADLLKLILSAEELASFHELAQRHRELKRATSTLAFTFSEDALQSRGGNARYRRARRLLAKLEQQPVPPAPWPPPTLPPTGDRLDRPRAVVAQQQRELAEWRDVWSSPTALRYLTEQWEAARHTIADKWRRNNTAPSIVYLLDVLGLRPNASKEQIRARYLQLMKEPRPDTNAGDATGAAQLQRVTKAYRDLEKMGRV